MSCATVGQVGSQAHDAHDVDNALAHAETIEHLMVDRADVAGLLDRTAVLRDAARAVRENTEFDLGFASSVEDNELTVIRGWSGDTAGGLRMLEVPSGLGLGGRTFALNRPQWVPDYCGSGLITHEFDTVVRAEGIGGMVAVPLVHRDTVIGVAYGAARGSVQIGDQLVRAMKRITAPAAAALHLAQRANGQTKAALSAERQRIAVALHDSVGALLFGIGAEVRDLQVDAHAAPQMLARLRAVEMQIAQTAAAFRESLAVLDEVTPDQSLTTTLRGDCEAFAARTGVVTRCVALTELPILDAARRRAVVAVVREALVNVEKHARASSVVVSLMTSGDGLAVAIADDGLGWPDAEILEQPERRRSRVGDPSSGIGLKAAYDRLARLGGALSTVGNEDGGLTIRVWVPSS